MTQGMKRIIELVDNEEILSKDVCDFILKDPEWLVLGIYIEKLNELRKVLNEADETRAGVWLR